MELDRPRHTIDFLFIISLLFLFVFSSIMMIALGAGCYQKVIDSMNKNSNLRSSCAYVIEKIRQSDSDGHISIGELPSTDSNPITSVILEQSINDQTYYTYLYEYNNYLSELMTSPESGLDASAGQQLIPIESFLITRTDNSLYRLNITTTDSQTFTIYIHDNLNAAADS